MSKNLQFSGTFTIKYSFYFKKKKCNMTVSNRYVYIHNTGNLSKTLRTDIIFYFIFEDGWINHIQNPDF